RTKRVSDPGITLAHVVRRPADGVELAPPPRHEPREPGSTVAPDDDRRMRLLHGLGKERAPLERVVTTLEGERRLREQPVDDLELLLEHLHALAARREREAMGSMLLLPPPRAQADLDPAVRDRVHGRDDLRE